MKQFIPFQDIELHKNKVIAVDSFHPKAFALSHWKGAVVPDEIMADTSTEIVLNALEKGMDLSSYKYVTNNHFDIDGFLGVWSLIYPEIALKSKSLLITAATIGDFREYNPEKEIDQLALKVCCWINTVEKDQFYPPFGTIFSEDKEAKRCVSKYHFFIEKFQAFLEDPYAHEADWKEEYDRVNTDISIIKEHGEIYNIKGPRMHIVRSPEPLHYYALYSHSQNTDMVLSLYDRNKYELEYKYTSWIDTKTRNSNPRVDLQPLAKKLNNMEQSKFKWDASKITDTAPVLRLEGKSLNKVQRYDHPYNRPIYSSSIMPDELLKVIINYFEVALENAERKPNFSWKEIREFNTNLKFD